MFEIKYLRQNLSNIKKAIKDRCADINLETFVKYDSTHKSILKTLEELRYRRNIVSDEIATLKKQKDDASHIILEMKSVSAKIKELEKSLTENKEILNKILFGIPNIPHESVPIGKNSEYNKVIKKVGDVPDFDFTPKAHWTIGKDLKIFDFERAAKITGSRFPLYFGIGAKIERALINFMLDMHTTKHGYTEVLPPFIVNKNSLINTGQLPKFEEDLFKIEGLEYFLIPTAEVPVTNIHQDEIISEADLPIKYTAYTPCFRSEAGSYGKDTKGLIRQHQFNKVEMVKFVTPENSYNELESLLCDAETILQELKLPYQVIVLCTGDLGFSAAKTYDIEVWMPSQKIYREISSCSNFESFQAKRGKIRLRRKDKKKPEPLHTLNGSGLAVGRTVAAILENYQQKDGSVIIPEVLRAYLGGIKEIKP